MRVDLNELQRLVMLGHRVTHDEAIAIIAELRAARNLRDAVYAYGKSDADDPADKILMAIWNAIAAYDEVLQ